jgi:hypothetical protein
MGQGPVPAGFVPDGFEPDAAPPPAASAKEPTRPGSNAALGLAAVGAAVPALQAAAVEVATNPNVPKIAAKVGRVVGGIAPIVAGAQTGGPVGALVGITASSKGAWAGGKTGWFTGKLAQNVAAPAAKALERAVPYAQLLWKAAGPQGILDLAQMAEPNRTDIGTLGVGINQTPRSADEKAAQPALLNLAATKVRDLIKELTGYGLKPEEAADILLTRIGGKK